MNRKLLGITLLSLLFLGTTASAQDKPATPPKAAKAEDVATQMQVFYKKTKDFQASFKQTYTDVAAGDKKVSFGRVFFKTPGKMRWDYFQTKKGKAKPQKTMVSDGANFWIYEHEFRQVFKECLKNSKLPTSLRFLMGQGDLLKDFNVSLGDKTDAKRFELKLIPKQPTPKYKELRFVVDGATYQVLKTTIFDPYGNTNEIVFNKVKFNSNLPDKGFSFKAPKGSRLLNPQQKCDVPKP